MDTTCTAPVVSTVTIGSIGGPATVDTRCLPPLTMPLPIGEVPVVMPVTGGDQQGAAFGASALLVIGVLLVRVARRA